MELKRYDKNPILVVNELHLWESKAVFNPGVVYDGEVFHMVYRALDSEGKSSIGYANSKDGISFKKSTKPLIKPKYEWEKLGCEDPRLMYFGDSYYITYVAVSKYEDEPFGFNKVRIAAAVTKDFKNVDKIGLIGPNHWSKGGVIFSEEINNKVVMLLTWTDWVDKPSSKRNPYPTSKIYKAEFESIEQLHNIPKDYWDSFIHSLKESEVILPERKQFPESEIGAPPIKTKDGWLLIYAGIDEVKEIWACYAVLLDLENLKKVIAHSHNPILWPEEKYEKEGLVPNVTFPEGVVVAGNELLVYYGAADSSVCLASAPLDKFLNSLEKI